MTLVRKIANAVAAFDWHWRVLIVMMCSCTDETNSRRALENEGMTDIHFTGYQVMACSDDDTFHTGFTATNSKGKSVSGVVCCGWIKSCTIRY